MQYPKPVNFDETNSEFDIFKNAVDASFFPAKIQFLRNVRISTNSVVFRYFQIFKESCISEENFRRYSKGFGFFFKFIFPKLNLSKKRFLLITDEWTSNYYHWHCFALNKLLVLKEKNLLKDSLLFLPKKYQTYPFAFSSLAKFGIAKNQIVFLRRKSNIKVNEVALVEASRQDPHIFRELRRTLTQNIKNSDDRIYISREGQVLRFVENEEEVVALLTKYGFKKILAEKLSYQEQVEIFAKAKYLVGPHGAGLTNILFMPENSCFLEMATKPDSIPNPTQTAEFLTNDFQQESRRKMKDVSGNMLSFSEQILAEKTKSEIGGLGRIGYSFNHDFYVLASVLGIKYFYQRCECGLRSKVADHHHASLVVDLAKLEKNLQLMLAQ